MLLLLLPFRGGIFGFGPMDDPALGMLKGVDTSSCLISSIGDDGRPAWFESWKLSLQCVCVDSEAFSIVPHSAITVLSAMI